MWHGGCRAVVAAVTNRAQWRRHVTPHPHAGRDASTKWHNSTLMFYKTPPAEAPPPRAAAREGSTVARSSAARARREHTACWHVNGNSRLPCRGEMSIGVTKRSYALTMLMRKSRAGSNGSAAVARGCAMRKRKCAAAAAPAADANGEPHTRKDMAPVIHSQNARR